MSASSPNTYPELAFNGTDGIEAEEFIRSVIKATKAAGKLRDNSWIVDEVSAAFAGDALRWYIELDDETRNDWLRLQRTIMQKYPPPAQRSPSDDSDLAISQASTGLVSAAAAPHPTLSAVARNSEKAYYIRVYSHISEKPAYIGIKEGRVVVADTRGDGLKVRHDARTKELCVIRMTGSTHRDTGDKLELRLSEGSYLDFGSHGSVRATLLQLLDDQGLPKGTNPIRDGDSFTLWDVTERNLLRSIPQYGSENSHRLLINPLDKELQPPIRADMGGLPHIITAFVVYLDLELEPL
ncbi:hypothetical protein FRC01_007364 [Tulasnella sp. 417]|nr:hypothetical protein FRC01_007364 [Tulasnella sp. 417]